MAVVTMRGLPSNWSGLVMLCWSLYGHVVFVVVVPGPGAVALAPLLWLMPCLLWLVVVGLETLFTAALQLSGCVDVLFAGPLSGCEQARAAVCVHVHLLFCQPSTEMRLIGTCVLARVRRRFVSRKGSVERCMLHLTFWGPEVDFQPTEVSYMVYGLACGCGFALAMQRGGVFMLFWGSASFSFRPHGSVLQRQSWLHDAWPGSAAMRPPVPHLHYNCHHPSFCSVMSRGINWCLLWCGLMTKSVSVL